MRPCATQTSIHIWMIDSYISAYGAIPTALLDHEPTPQPISSKVEPYIAQPDPEHSRTWVDNLITLGLMTLVLTVSSLTLGWALEKTAQGIVTLTQHTLSELQ